MEGIRRCDDSVELYRVAVKHKGTRGWAYHGPYAKMSAAKGQVSYLMGQALVSEAHVEYTEVDWRVCDAG